MSKISGLKFGDIVENGHAGESNPRRTGVFLQKKKRTIAMTDMKGDFWETFNDEGSKLKKIGSIL